MFSEIRQSKQYEVLRRIVFARDKYRCKLCGYKGPRLEMHHIIRFYDELKFLDLQGLTKQQSLNKIRKETGALNARNCITICSKCHQDLVTRFEYIWAPLLKYLLSKNKDKDFIRKELGLLKKQLPIDIVSNIQFKKISKFLIK